MKKLIKTEAVAKIQELGQTNIDPETLKIQLVTVK